MQGKERLLVVLSRKMAGWGWGEIIDCVKNEYSFMVEIK
jgi:hypothetical protein